MSLGGAIWCNDRTDGRASGAQKIGWRSREGNGRPHSRCRSRRRTARHAIDRSRAPCRRNSESPNPSVGSRKICVPSIAREWQGLHSLYGNRHRCEATPKQCPRLPLFQNLRNLLRISNRQLTCTVPHCTNDGGLQHDNCDHFWLQSSPFLNGRLAFQNTRQQEFTFVSNDIHHSLFGHPRLSKWR